MPTLSHPTVSIDVSQEVAHCSVDADGLLAHFEVLATSMSNVLEAIEDIGDEPKHTTGTQKSARSRASRSSMHSGICKMFKSARLLEIKVELAKLD